MQRDIRISRIYPHSPEDIWFALTDRDAIGEWLMENDFEPRLGHRFTFRTKPAPGFDGIVHCEVLALDEPRHLSYSWRGGPINTIVTFRLEPVENGTRLLLEQTGFVGIRALMVSHLMNKGFIRMFDQKLPALLDRIERGELAAGRNSCHVPDATEKGITTVLKWLDR